jgi:hypothetical protein
MDTQKQKRTDTQTNRQSDKKSDKQIQLDRHKDGQTCTGRKVTVDRQTDKPKKTNRQETDIPKICRTDRQTDRQTERHTDRKTERQSDKKTDKQRDRQIDGQTKRQTDRRTKSERHEDRQTCTGRRVTVRQTEG